MRSINCLLGLHEWKAELHDWYKVEGDFSDHSSHEILTEGRALSSLINPDFKIPVPQCSKCGYIPDKILKAQIDAYLGF